MQTQVLAIVVGYLLYAGADYLTTPVPPPGVITPGPANYDSSGMKYDYGKALGMSILFYDAQRAGKLPDNNPIPWRGDSLLYEVGDNGEDLTGGWFDAGDHVKFHFPMAYSSWVLNWGLLRFTEAYVATGQLDMMCDMVKWPLDYFLKCWIPENMTLYTGIGDADLDHEYFYSPELWDIERPAWQVNTSCPGSDIASEFAAAFASGYLVFSTICPAEDGFAESLLDAGKSVYAFATEYIGSYTGCYEDSIHYYSSKEMEDELTNGAIWMYKATGEEKYLNDAKAFYPTQPDPPNVFKWEHKGAAADLLLYEETGDDLYLNSTIEYLTSCMPGGSKPKTTCGMVHLQHWGSARLAANAALLALMVADDNITATEYKEWALTQINYLLGDNNYNMSYQVGFGDNFPTHYHHRASACISTILECDWESTEDNPNMLYGALVGGPDESEFYHDNRSDYVLNEVAVDYSAGFHSALAGLVYFSINDDLPESPPSLC